MAFAVGKQFVILLNMSKTNPEAQKLLDDLDNISQEDFNQRFGELLGNNKSADKKPEVGDVDDLMQDAATDNLIENKDKTVDNPLKGVEPIDAETSFDQPKGDTKQTKSALEGIKGMDYEPTKYVYERITPIRNTIHNLQKDKFEKGYQDSVNSVRNDFTFELSDEVEEILDSDEMYEFIDGIINNDTVGLTQHANKYYDKYLDMAGDGESHGLRNVFLQEYYKPIYKAPKVLSKNEFDKFAKGKKIIYRGVETTKAVEKTLFSNDAWYMYGGAKGDGIYMTEDLGTAQEYSSGVNDETIMQFVVPDDFRSIDYTVLHRIGRRFSERITEKIRNIAMGKIDEKTGAKLEELERIQNFMEVSQFTPIAVAMGFDSIEVNNTVYSKKTNKNEMYKNYIFLNLDRLTALDITKGEK